jgi:hypothetical protein
MFWTVKFSFDEDDMAFLAPVLATFSNIWANVFPNLLVTLLTLDVGVINGRKVKCHNKANN